jgi:hypothetical protein
MSDSSLVPAEKMRALTGLSDKQLRGLAGKGFFPSPVRGQYQFIPSLIGLFRFYREQQEAGPQEIYYDTLGNCARQLEIPEPVLKALKRAGCPAFKGGRVYLFPLVKWIFTQKDGQEVVNWFQEKAKVQTLREKIKLTKEEQNAADWDDIAFGLSKGMSVLQASLEKLFEQTLPPLLEKKPKLEIKKRMVAALKPALAEFRAEISALGTLPAATGEKKADE